MVHLEQALSLRGSPPHDVPGWRWSSARLALVLALVTVITRAAPFGSPVAHVDDEFYLLVGQLMLEGQWPYVDIWDRKPVGLFAIYALIAAISGQFAVQGVQIAAGLCALGTAFIVARIARRIASDRGAILAGIAYLLSITMFGGQTGQSPIFYNLLIAGAALLFVRSIEEGDSARLFSHAIAAMLLCGLAMVIKQISFIEGGFIGLAFLWRFHQLRLPLAGIAARALVMMVVALAPTLLAFAIYAAAGHGEAFWFANFVSIFLKHPVGGDSLKWGFQTLLKYMPLIALLTIWGATARWRASGWTPLNVFLAGWIVAAIAGYLFVPYFFNHYALPLMVPFSISAATIYERRHGPLFALLLLVVAVLSGMLNFPNHARRIEAARTLTEVVQRELRGGCLYLAGSRTYFYSATDACRPSRFIFPDHLNAYAERDGIGVDQLTEVRRIFAAAPSVVLTDREFYWPRTPEVQAFIEAELRRHYRPVFHLPGTRPKNLVSTLVWSRTDRSVENPRAAKVPTDAN